MALHSFIRVSFCRLGSEHYVHAEYIAHAAEARVSALYRPSRARYITGHGAGLRRHGDLIVCFGDTYYIGTCIPILGATSRDP